MADLEPPLTPSPPETAEAPAAPAPSPAAPAPPAEPAPAVEAPPLVLEQPVEAPLETAKPRKRRGLLGKLAFAFFLLVVAIPVGATLAYRFVPPPGTLLMLLRLSQGQGLTKHWRPLSAISPALPQAVIAAEDARFCEHHGFDFQAMEKAALSNERGRKVRGGSTISQQTAKNVFLWPDRTYVRKGLEAYFTVLIEALWGKHRIIEVYLNVVEWGPGIYGAEAAAQRYFHVDAKHLSRAQAARLAAILPSPLKWQAVSPGPYVAKRSQRIGAAAVTVREDDLAACVR